MRSRFLSRPRKKEEGHYATTTAAARETASEAGHSQSTRSARDRATSSGSVAVNVHVVAEILNQHQILGPEHIRIRGAGMEIRNHEMFFRSCLDKGRRKSVLSEIELCLRLRVIGGGVGNVSHDGSRRHGFVKRFEAAVEVRHPESVCIAQVGVRCDYVQQEPQTGRE